ncbi:unnamed protein product, partial [Mesorhabditis spiculigera]
MAIKDAWVYKATCRLLRSFLKFAPDVTLNANETHPHLSDYIHAVEHAVEDTNFVREHPGSFFKTCVALSVALVLCYIIFHVLLSIHRFFMVKVTGRRRTPLILCPGDMLPTVEADSLQANRKPNVVKRMNEPVDVCLFYTKPNQGQVTPKVLSPPKPVEPKVEQPPPHHVAISETLVEEKKPQTQLVSPNNSPQDISLVKAVKRESLLNMRILNSTDDPNKQLGRHDSERGVEVPDPTVKSSPRSVTTCRAISPANSTFTTVSSCSLESQSVSLPPASSNPPLSHLTISSGTPSSGQTTMPSDSSASVKAPSVAGDAQQLTGSTSASISSASLASSNASNSTQSLLANFTDAVNPKADRSFGGCDGSFEENTANSSNLPRLDGGKEKDIASSPGESTTTKEPSKEKKANAKLKKKPIDVNARAMAMMQMWPSSTLVAGCVHCQNQPLYPVTFRWHDLSPKSVFISGSFVNWELKIPLRRDRYGWVVEIQLPKGHFEYRFLVDRQWAIDEKRQQVLLTRSGQLNHVVHV